MTHLKLYHQSPTIVSLAQQGNQPRHLNCCPNSVSHIDNTFTLLLWETKNSNYASLPCHTKCHLLAHALLLRLIRRRKYTLKVLCRLVPPFFVDSSTTTKSCRRPRTIVATGCYFHCSKIRALLAVPALPLILPSSLPLWSAPLPSLRVPPLPGS